MKNQKIIPLPIHFKKPGRSYSQIGRKGNVALYSVHSDYCTLFTALPYLLIGYELIVIKTKRNGTERYPRDEEFGASGWAIPKSLSRSRRTRFGSRIRRWAKFRVQEFASFLNRSTSSADCACPTLAPT